jgi:hypothetical protein
MKNAETPETRILEDVRGLLADAHQHVVREPGSNPGALGRNGAGSQRDDERDRPEGDEGSC